jgi:hypothetical protein
VTPIDVPQNDEAIDDADDDQSNAAAADKQLWPGDENESSVQAAYSEESRRGARGLGDRKRPGVEGHLVCAQTSFAH